MRGNGAREGKEIGRDGRRDKEGKETIIYGLLVFLVSLFFLSSPFLTFHGLPLSFPCFSCLFSYFPSFRIYILLRLITFPFSFLPYFPSSSQPFSLTLSLLPTRLVSFHSSLSYRESIKFSRPHCCFHFSVFILSYFSASLPSPERFPSFSLHNLPSSLPAPLNE